MRRRAPANLDLFEVPRPAEPLPGSMDYRTVVAQLLSEMIRQSGMDRYEVAAAVSRLTGKDVSKYMIDGYTAESRDVFNAPAYLMPAFEAACQSHLYSSWLGEVRGGRLLIGHEALAAELGRIERQKDELVALAKGIKDQLRRAR